MSSLARKKITIVGSGYVGMSLSVLLAQHNDVKVLEIDEEKISKINDNKSTVADKEIQDFLNNKGLSIEATNDKNLAYQEADFIIIATPTDYDSQANRFDTSTVDLVAEEALKFTKKALIIIKSTIPIGHTKFLNDKLNTSRITFSPEFLREGQALKDNLYPERIIIGGKTESTKEFVQLLVEASHKERVDTLYMDTTEAESVKLFSNAYLAMRVSFFNELDSYALSNGLDSESIINGVCLDDRIGTGYNNPSFGYGGYCLPKDTKQLLANFDKVPQSLIGAIVSSNSFRKNFIVDRILERKPRVVGFYRLTMKDGSDNFRFSAVQDIIKIIDQIGIKIVIFEPYMQADRFEGKELVKDLSSFKDVSDVIVANRRSNAIADVNEKIISRDIFNNN